MSLISVSPEVITKIAVSGQIYWPFDPNPGSYIFFMLLSS